MISIPRDHGYTRGPGKISNCSCQEGIRPILIAPFGDAYEKIGMIQRRLAWPLHKDDTLFQSGRPTGLNIYFSPPNPTIEPGTIPHSMFWVSLGPLTSASG